MYLNQFKYYFRDMNGCIGDGQVGKISNGDTTIEFPTIRIMDPQVLRNWEDHGWVNVCARMISDVETTRDELSHLVTFDVYASIHALKGFGGALYPMFQDGTVLIDKTQRKFKVIRARPTQYQSHHG